MTNPSSTEAPYNVTIARSRKCVARDGVTLSVDINRPARVGDGLPGSFPPFYPRSHLYTRSVLGPCGN
jgi:predicted acyl esterase